MRIRRLVSILPFVLLGSACGADMSDVDAQSPVAQESELASTTGRSLSQLKAQRPDFLRGAGDLAFKRAVADANGKSHERLTQSINGIPVFGAQAIVHLDANGTVASITDGLARDVKVDTSARLRADEATQIAISQVGGAVALASEPKVDLQILPDSIGKGARLTYRVQLATRTADGAFSMPNVFVDAHSGEVAFQFDNLKTSRNRNTYTVANGTRLPGSLVRTETQAPVSDAVANAAHDNAGITYNFYFSRFGRDSYNGTGGTLTSSVHYSRNYVNAYWDGTQMVYGDGDGVQSSPLIVLDVIGHELTHAVTDTSSDLVYANESGALNEAMSDIFGASIEAYRDGAVSANTWKIGEECWTPATAGDALRYMNDPALAGDYDYYPTRYTGTSDNGGVHTNSGIANLAYYLAVSGGTHPRGKTTTVVPALDANPTLSIEKGAAIFYRANTVYLTPGSTFSEARGATAQAATDLYGATAAASVNAAWAAVGVAAPPTWTVLSSTSNLSAGRNASLNYTTVTPAGATALKFETIGGTGDADLYVRYGSAPTTTTYDCRSAGSTATEGCTINGAKSGTYYVMIKAYTAFSGVTYKVSSGQ
ncbi:M4 family metallopeptidase [Archangium sp.]|uniref:M4 family metallopeptidase n=1 Tax=Archangium sp. TaxID=1872627 RepID=UPI00389A025A